MVVMMMVAALVLKSKAAVVLETFVAAGVFDVLVAAGEIVVVVGQNVWDKVYEGNGKHIFLCLSGWNRRDRAFHDDPHCS